MNRTLRLLATAVAALAILVFGAAGARRRTTSSLGDSYAAGPLIPNPVLPLGCLKSSNNYPRLAAPTIGLHTARPELQRRPDRRT